MVSARQLHHLYTDVIASRLRKQGVCARLEYTGSVYEGVKVRRSDSDSDIEFDIMIILRCRTDRLGV